jgi:hypothetical protein
MNPYNNPRIAATRQLLDILDREVDVAISEHDHEREDALYDVKRAVFRLQVRYLRELQRREVAA